MNRLQATIVFMLLGLALNGCATLEEDKLLTPTRVHPDLGLRLRVSPPDELPEDIRGTRNQILRVVLVRPGRPAALAGIETGDILLSLDGKPVTGVDDSVGLMQLRQWDDSVIVTILRDGQILEIPVILNNKSEQTIR